MEKQFQKNGGAAIQALIDAAVENGTRCATVTGNYEIEKTILIPSEFTLFLENCHLVLGEGTFCNMFTNEHCRTEIGRTTAGTDRNIVIEGRGRVILDGGKYNGLGEKNHSRDGRPHISYNNTLLFANVDGFTVKNLHVRNQRWWGLNFVFCRNGYIGNIDFCSSDVWVDEDGTEHHGYMGEGFDYAKILIKNSDGIDLRSGCHDIIIENITGFTEDDTIALTALQGKLEAMYGVEGLCPDIYNVIIRNVNAAAQCSIVRLLNQGALKLYNVLIDGVVDASANNPHMDRGPFGIRIGDGYHMYGSRFSTKDETYNITVRNVVTRATKGVHLSGAMANITLDNIKGFDGNQILIDNKADIS